VRRRDVCISYPIEENFPLNAHFYVAPHTKSKMVRFRNVRYQVSLLFKYSHLESGQDLDFQLVLSHGVQGPWPPMTYVVFKGGRNI
jgi:hypothetical protein